MIKIFNEDFPKTLPSCNGLGPMDTYVNMYVKIGSQCQSRCSFCKFYTKENKGTFDRYKFFYALHQVKKSVPVNKVSFTGGEPTLYMEDLLWSIKAVHDIDPKIQIVVSTNGNNLKDLIEVAPLVHSFAISRHHYYDEENKNIFKGNVPSINEIGDFIKAVGKNKVHITCNLMKSHISSLKSIYSFLSTITERTGAVDFGFVGLMELNDFCKKEKVNIKDISFDKVRGTVKTRTYEKTNTCCCSNYMTTTRNGEIVKFYVRQTLAPAACENVLTYQDNCVTQRSAGKILFS